MAAFSGSPGFGVGEGDVFLPELWSKEVLRATEANLVLANLVARYDDLTKEGGDVIRIPQLSNLTATAKAADSPVTIQATTESSITISLNRHYESSVLVEDRLKVQAKYNLLKEFAAKAGYAIAAQIDTDLAGLYSGFSQTITAAASLTDANIVRAIQYLDDANAPQTDRSLVIKPATKGDLLQIDKFVGIARTVKDTVTTGGAAIQTADVVRTGQFGEIYGVRVYVTTQIVTATNDQNMMFHKEAAALAIQMPARTQIGYMQEYLGTLVTADSIWGFAELRDTFGVVIPTTP